jgi:hypothetical protein
MPPVPRAQVNPNGFNQNLALPYSLRLTDFATAMDDIYLVLSNINDGLMNRGLLRIEESVRSVAGCYALRRNITLAPWTHWTVF